MQNASCVIGIDTGTSGVRAIAINKQSEVLSEVQVRFADGVAAADRAAALRSPAHWWQAVKKVLTGVLRVVDPGSVVAIAVDGTSGTVLAVDSSGEPVAAPMMYNDAVEDQQIIDRIAASMTETSAAGGVTSGLAKALVMQALKPYAIIHQADWIVGQLSGNYRLSDANNALKTGFDPIQMQWPAWIDDVAPVTSLLPDVAVPGDVFATVHPSVCASLNLPSNVQLVAGTTDGCASFLATGASNIGDGVTALGSTITLKLLSDQPVFAPQCGVYSHRIGDKWLAGGASNSGGTVLEAYFDQSEIESLSKLVTPSESTGLNYYPLRQPGERFPVNDPHKQPCLTPRPKDDVTFLQAMLEGMASIENNGYQMLVEAGGPALVSMRTVGGGASNIAWEKIRKRCLRVPFEAAISQQAAFGTALLAQQSANKMDLW